ncbi:MAG: spore coat protein [Dorea sp.]|nr:spore coat protein [Dorea sp.]
MELTIGGKIVSNDTPALIIAEAGINHDRKLEQAYQLIDMAANAGADVVKFQLFTVSHMYPTTAGEYRTANGKKTEIYDLIKDVELPEAWIPRLMERCRKRNIGFLCTTCDEASTDKLDKYGVDSYKIASGEITYLPLFEHTAQKGKTVIFSEGAASLTEIANVVEILRAVGNKKLALLHCTAEYPAKMEDCNVNLIETYRRIFPDILIGFSDHTMDPSEASIQAVKMGAKIIEKHITVDRSLPGADHCFALEEKDLRKLVEEVRYAQRHLEEIEKNPVICGRTDKVILREEESLRKFTHRGIFASVDLAKGERLTKDNIIVLRPGNSENGIEPQFYHMLLENGVRVNKAVANNHPIRWEDVLKA